MGKIGGIGFDQVAARSWQGFAEGIKRIKTQYLHKVCTMFEGKCKVSLVKI